MTWTVDQSGTTSALVIGTETQLGTNSTTNATYQTQIDTTNLATGDILEVRVYTQIASGGSPIIFWKGTYPGSRAQLGIPTPPQPSAYAYKVTLKQTSGTGRTFSWTTLRQ